MKSDVISGMCQGAGGWAARLRRQQWRRLGKGRAVAALSVAVLLAACSLEQVQLGQWYRLITPATGACPMREWRFEVDPTRHIGGHVNRIDDGRIATLDGTLAADDTYHMTATAVDGGATAQITGQFRRVLTIIAINGNALGAECNGTTIRLRYINYYGYSGGGGGGR